MKTFRDKPYRTFLFLSLGLFLSACDIEPVSSGIWEIDIEGLPTYSDATWNVSASGVIAVSAATDFTIDSVQLSGSRISWTEDLQIDGNQSKANFNGTVSGNSLQGTLYTDAGNFTVFGLRR